MTSKVARIAAGICEAVWLAAIISIPLFFNVHSSRIFEPDKIVVLRSLALIGLGAWIIRLIEDGWRQAGISDGRTSRIKQLFSIPLILPVVLLAASVLLSSALSIAPRTSFGGSYQRLQGTVTFFSYLTIFILITANLRTKAQLDRLLTTIVLASLPVAFYGILQRYGLDPVPWGGNVQNRIAANMGNSIFAAAYLIMVIPITAGKIAQEFRKILSDESNLALSISRGTLFVFILILNLIAVYLTGSRGPFLGLLAGLFFLLVLLFMYWRRRGLLVGTVILAVVFAALLLLINIPGGPLESIRTSPWVGRLGQVLDMNQRTSRVRTLIWEGAAELVAPHDPLTFPDGEVDTLNPLRPVIGYGPESMYVAYNRFFPPELAIIEKRNASPDRSHNETWDVLVTNGVLGSVIYQFLFISIFYYGLKWLGLLADKNQRLVFLACYFGFGIASAVVVTLWQGPSFLGVGIPFGEMIGLVAFLTYSAIFIRPEVEAGGGGFIRSLTLIVILSGIIAHFVEVHFGIAIAATRLYFWVYAGVLLVAGYLLPEGMLAEPNTAIETAELDSSLSRRKRSRTVQGGGISWQPILVNACIVAIVLVTLAYDYLANLDRSGSWLTIINNSFLRLPLEDFAFSPGILGLLTLSWLICAYLLTTNEDSDPGKSLRAYGLTLLIAAGLTVPFIILQANNLAGIFTGVPSTQAELLEQVNRYAALPVWYGGYLVLLLALLGSGLSSFWQQNTRYSNAFSLVAAVALIPAALYVGLGVNFRTIQADIIFKQADPFMKSGQYGAAVLIYREAIDHAPNEDHYYLFLGRAYLEYAQNLQDAEQREAILQQAEQDLLQAQDINPLNTDHTANLARLYSWVGTAAGNPESRQQAFEAAERFYEQALTISPNNAGLWTEQAILELNSLGEPENALQSAEVAITLDPTFDRPYALLGDYHVQAARNSQTEEDAQMHLAAAVENYQKAAEVMQADGGNPATLYTYYLALGGVYVEMEALEEAVDAYSRALQYAGPDNAWRVQETLALVYYRLGDKTAALTWAEQASNSAPEADLERLANLIDQINSLP